MQLCGATTCSSVGLLAAALWGYQMQLRSKEHVEIPWSHTLVWVSLVRDYVCWVLLEGKVTLILILTSSSVERGNGNGNGNGNGRKSGNGSAADVGNGFLNDCKRTQNKMMLKQLQ